MGDFCQWQLSFSLAAHSTTSIAPSYVLLPCCLQPISLPYLLSNSDMHSECASHMQATRFFMLISSKRSLMFCQVTSQGGWSLPHKILWHDFWFSKAHMDFFLSVIVCHLVGAHPDSWDTCGYVTGYPVVSLVQGTLDAKHVSFIQFPW